MDNMQIKQLIGKKIQDNEQNVYYLQYVGVYVATLEPLIIFIQPTVNESVQVRPLLSFFKRTFNVLGPSERHTELLNETYRDTKTGRKYSLIANGRLINANDMHVYVSIYRETDSDPSKPVLVRNWNVFNDGRNQLL